MKLPSVAEMYAEMSDEEKAALDDRTREMFEQQMENERRKANYLAELVSERKFVDAAWLFDSQNRGHALAEWFFTQDLSDDEIRALITNCWTVSEAWQGDERARSGMTQMLQRVAPIFVYGDDETEHISAMTPEPITIYRFNWGEEPHGIASWSMERETAERLGYMASSIRGQILGMYQEDGVGSIWRGKIRPEHILGYFNDRNEQEVVCDRYWMWGVEKIAEMRSKDEVEEIHDDDYSGWCRTTFNSIRDGGVWGVPRSGLVFTKTEEPPTFTLTERMPWTEELEQAADEGRDVPQTAEELAEYQDTDYLLIKEQFEKAGIAVTRDV